MLWSPFLNQIKFPLCDNSTRCSFYHERTKEQTNVNLVTSLICGGVCTKYRYSVVRSHRSYREFRFSHLIYCKSGVKHKLLGISLIIPMVQQCITLYLITLDASLDNMSLTGNRISQGKFHFYTALCSLVFSGLVNHPIS